VSVRTSRLYAPRVERPLHIALVEPEIPPNTGNVARLCAATGCVLHLIGPLGFRIDEHAVRRAGLDYWEEVELHQHRSYAEAQANLAASRAPNGPPPRAFFFSARADRSYVEVSYRQGDVLVFGRESVGLPETLLADHAEQVVGIPLLGRVRSLNLANAVAIAAYEALRQLGLLANAQRGELSGR
jgi:tRNA (cytidine/uridine-2'-O-)-methyltransferase